MATARELLTDMSEKLRLAVFSLKTVDEEVASLTVGVGALPMSESAARVRKAATMASKEATRVLKAAEAAEAAATNATEAIEAAGAAEMAEAEAAAAVAAAAAAARAAAAATRVAKAAIAPLCGAVKPPIPGGSMYASRWRANA